MGVSLKTAGIRRLGVTLKEITAAGATAAALTDKVWGEYFSVVDESLFRLAITSIFNNYSTSARWM